MHRNGRMGESSQTGQTCTLHVRAILGDYTKNIQRSTFHEFHVHRRAVGWPPQLVKKNGTPHSSTVCVSEPGALAPAHSRNGRAGSECGRGSLPFAAGVLGCHHQRICKISHRNSCFLVHFQPEN